ncbi:hypothetical protein COCC4DRAFT_59952 [Bipolaris maydis ATCC 48331]|uniref:Uncharacterized protein n=2 Tax=Cochliobolus heterostrophus TaxID=5016 RepID=M2UF65_COCH5|nr:uncharacterized protein COCC4DRAFT_59952 [Bipolaris maydis ATCC 48331]EMD86537.1 hypothetical protein COCHEDRAFT_1034951 [Bipolaris maydis C5]ENI06485.1 hypothetical protein COCC4DRAFT_59952 [Bipolaris maydis ATCC 48331]
MAGPVGAIIKHGESWLVLEITNMMQIALPTRQNGQSSTWMVAFPTTCAVTKGIGEGGERFGRAARASHVVAGTKMTPMAERWPELDFCSLPREQSLVAGSTCAYLVIAQSRLPNNHKGCVRLCGTRGGNIVLGLLFEKSKCTVPDNYGMPMSDWHVPCCRFMHTFRASTQLH